MPQPGIKSTIILLYKHTAELSSLKRGVKTRETLKV